MYISWVGDCDCDFKGSHITVAETGAVVAVAATAGCNNAKRTMLFFTKLELLQFEIQNRFQMRTPIFY